MSRHKLPWSPMRGGARPEGPRRVASWQDPSPLAAAPAPDPAPHPVPHAPPRGDVPAPAAGSPAFAPPQAEAAPAALLAGNVRLPRGAGTLPKPAFASPAGAGSAAPEDDGGTRRRLRDALLLCNPVVLPRAPRIAAPAPAAPAASTPPHIAIGDARSFGPVPEAAAAPAGPGGLTQPEPAASPAASAGAADRPGADAGTQSQMTREPTPPGSDTPATPAATPRPGPGGGGDLYLTHFGLSERPFSLLPDPDFLFWSPAHSRAYAILEYGILTRAPITLVTGEVGAGKTTLVHHLLRNLAPEVKVGLISNAQGSRGELLRWVHMALGQTTDPQATYVDLFAAFQRLLIAQYAAGNRVVLIFDEAQNLDRTTLEELRMFTNINAGKDELLQLILVGQPELRDIIRRPDMAQFAQRVAASFHLPAMDLETLRAYVGHRLQVAGGQAGLFEPGALELVHAASGGVPRLVNQLCDLSMVYAYARNHQTVNRHTVRHVLDDGVFFGGTAELPPETADREDRGDVV